MTEAVLSPRLAELAAALEREPRAQVPLDRCRELFHAARCFDSAEEPDPHRALAAALTALEAGGRIRLPSRRSRHLWSEERNPPVPVRVRVLRAAPPAPAAARPLLHPVLSLAQERAQASALPGGVAALDAWLKRAAPDLEPVPLQERSYEVFGDEKRLGHFLATRFAVAGGLRPESFGAFRVFEPFVVSPLAGAEAGAPPTAAPARPTERAEAATGSAAASWAIAVENLATYDSVRRAFEDAPARRTAREAGLAAVIYGRGNHVTSSCASLPERLPAVRRLVYFGDLDERGLSIPLS
ncbi:MAG TPA: hypothetical protein VHF22_02205, partial [Planctomycetota bacterium]|nr:hypothetical protein [Planctomycetota bacterium]